MMEIMDVVGDYPKIKKLLKEVVHRIIQQCDPLKIMLFGSYAYGTPSTDSDIDLLVIIKQSTEPRYKRVAALNRVLTDLEFPRDILVYTQKEIDEWSEVPLAFISTIIRRGKVLYEKE
jgi:uncharacterized protein